MQQLKASAAFSDTKPHYDLLDGLRGVAAILVLWYHVFEGYAFAANAPIIETPPFKIHMKYSEIFHISF